MPYLRSRIVNEMTHILYVPGSSGTEDSERIETIRSFFLSKQCDFEVFDAWKNSDELQTKNLHELSRLLTERIDSLSSKGSQKVCLIAKSFGGTLSLIQPNPLLSSMVLWAPVISVGETGTLETPASRSTLSTFTSIRDIFVSRKTLSQTTMPCLILCGTNDIVVSENEMLTLSMEMPNTTYIKVKNMGHSPKTEFELDTLLQETYSFIK